MAKQLIKFGKNDCEPCVELDKYLHDNGVTNYTKIDPYEDFELGLQYNVSNIPTVVLLENREVIKRCVGGLGKNPARYDELIKMYKQ